MRPKFLLCIGLLSSAAAFASPPSVTALADDWLAGFAAHDPLEARLWGVDAGIDRLLGDPSRKALATWLDRQRQLGRALAQVNIGALDEPLLEGPEAVVAAARADTRRLIAAAAPLFPPLPPRSVEVVTYPVSQRPGLAASYRPDFDRGYAGTYTLNPDSPRLAHPRSAELIAAHEVVPGHHMQAMVAYHAGAVGRVGGHPILTVGVNNAFVEGWAQYAEILAVEEGLLEHPATRVSIWLDRGSVIPLAVRFNTGQADEAETARAALVRRGTPDADPATADNVLDWLAVMPGQILSYDLGADAILRLRDRAWAGLGEDFDYPTFHRLVLEEGSVPLWRIEQKVEAWIVADGG